MAGTTVDVSIGKAEISSPLESLILREVPVGIAVYRGHDDKNYSLLYCNEEVCKISGYTKEELFAINPGQILKCIDEDENKVNQAFSESFAQMKYANTVYRTRGRNGELKSIQISARILPNKIKTKDIYVVYNDVTEPERRMAAIELENRDMIHMANAVSGGIFRCENKRDWPLVSANDVFFSFAGYTREEFKERFGNLLGAIIPEEDKGEIAKKVKKALASGSRVFIQHRIIPKNGAMKWIECQIECFQYPHGERNLSCNFIDISERVELQQQLKLYRSTELSGVFSVIINEYFTLAYGNDKYYRIHEYTKASMLKRIQNHCIEYVHPEDRAMVKETVAKALEKGDVYIKWVMRVVTGRGHIRYILCSGMFEKKNGLLVMNGVVMDITEQKEAEKALRESEGKLSIATAASGISFWSYDIKTKTLLGSETSPRMHLNMGDVKDVPASLISSGYVRSDSVNDFNAMYDSLRKGAKKASGDFWFQNNQKNGWWCEHIDYTTQFGPDGKPWRANAIGRDVTALKIAEKRYLEEAQFANATQSENLLVKVRANISKDVLESYDAKDNVRVAGVGVSYTVSLELLAQTGYTSDERALIRTSLDRNRILDQFAKGEGVIQIEYRRKLKDGSVLWVHTTVKTYCNPDSGDVMSFLYCYDINDEKMRDGIIEAVVALEYDYIVHIDLNTDRFNIFVNSSAVIFSKYSENDSFSSAISRVVREIVVEADRGMVGEALMRDNMRKNLESQRMMSLVYTVANEKGEMRQKRIQYAYLDKLTGKVLMIRSDVTELLAQQRQQHMTLESALLAAKQANSAKSDFLSRMSHEIRTPMNAIIGMTAIAAKSIGNDDQVADCIGKIGISSRFLLSLINDILDMSRIESGKLLLKSDKFSFEDLINEINTICYSQASAKNIDYECIIDPSVEDYYIGDTMKLQQIVINVLSNAVKFTPEKGRIGLNVLQVKRSKSCSTLRFVVNDTGCGISEQFLPHIFDAFSQEHSGSTTQYSGTGLGLAICKNLVDMMDGNISVRSIVGAGTEFTIDVKLGITKEARTRYLDKANYSFAKLKTLVVDDDTTVCEHTVLTLAEIGVKAEWVDSGYTAVKRVKEEWGKQKSYDLILVDWKMPGMDGIETSREIRKIVGPDVTIIIMTAYDWAAIETEAKMAGVNYLVRKPMFKTNLVSAFEKVIGAKEEEETQLTETFRFDGKRVLLAEDHPLNVEVARRLLEFRGFKVDHAENGIRALEMFATSPVGYYDAILMDIRMPQMDGLQAASAIRHLSKQESRTIPIIAMTANAFDEDIQKSRASGMNAHLAKPIDPKTLYQVLYDFIFLKKEGNSSDGDGFSYLS